MSKLMTVGLACLVIVAIAGTHSITASDDKDCSPTGIDLALYQPSGQKFTHGDEVTFIGVTIDDCGDAVFADAHIVAGQPGFYEECDRVLRLGANAHVCRMTITESWPTGTYDAYMFATSSELPPAMTVSTSAFRVV